MTNEQAIKILKKGYPDINRYATIESAAYEYDVKIYNEALDIAIHALETGEVYMNGKDYNLYLEGYKQGKKDFERPKGEWTDLSTDGRHIGWIACSVCGQEPPSESNLRTNFCPNCGAEMKKGGKENG